MLRKKAAGVIGRGLAVLLALAGPAWAQDRIVVSGGADAIALSPPDVFAYLPDRMLMEHITDPLLRWETPGKLMPWLVSDWHYIDDLTLELKLRHDVKFQDGEPFNAASVKFFYDTINDPKLNAIARSNHIWVDRIEIIDDDTVRLITKTPMPAALAKLTDAYVMPPDYIRKMGLDYYRQHPIGTGSFKFTERVRDDHITLDANPGWWRGPPQIKQIVYRPIKEEAARAAALLTGEVDVAFDLPPEVIPMVQASGRATIKQVASARTYILQMSNVNPTDPTNNPKLREAISYAIDRVALNKAILGGTGAPAAFLSQSMFGIDPNLPPVAYDPQRAKRALTEAGYSNGLSITLDTSDGRYVKDKELAEAIGGELTAVGIRTTVQPYEWGVMAKRRASNQLAPLVLMAWVDSNSDPDVMNTRVLRSDGVQSVARDPKLDALMDRISGEMDFDKRKAMIVQQQEMMRQDNQVAFLLHIGIIVGTSKRMAWWNPTANEKYLFYKLN